MPIAKKASKEKPSEKEAGSITFSTRFTEEQRDRIVQAAEVRGWTPSNLMRVATVEKAAHILNTSRQTKFDFKGLAMKVAKQLTSPASMIVGEDPGDNLYSKAPQEFFGQWTDSFGFDTPPRLETDSLGMADIQILKQAARLGGTEVLGLIIETCESLLAPNSKDLPEPVEPN